MYKTREELIAALGVEQMPALFGARFDEVMAAYEKEGVPFLQDAFLDGLQACWGIWRRAFDFVKKAAKRVRKNDLLARYSLLLYHMQLDNDHRGEISIKPLPRGGEGEESDFEMATLFSQIAFIPDMVAYHEAHGLPRDILADTLNDCFEEPILVCRDCFGRDGSHPRCFPWNQIYMNYRILRVGVLNFELRHRFTSAVTVFENAVGERVILANGRDIAPGGQLSASAGQGEVAFHAEITETDSDFEGYAADPVRAVYASTPVRLDKREWRAVLRAEDDILNVHIPSHVALTRENVDAALVRAWKVLRACYPEYAPKCFACFSWLLDPQLKQFLKPDSNLVAFQERYRLFALASCGSDVREFLFKKPVDRIEDFCEDTSLQRAVKAHYLKGNYIYAQGGVIFPHREET